MLYDMEKDEKIPMKGTFFRKLYSLPDLNRDQKDLNRERCRKNQLREKQLIEHLQRHPHPNVVTFYRVTERYVDMEYLYPLESHDTLERILPVMEKVKTFLQGIGVIYMDWKLDNLVKGKNGYTLIDFDHSGIATMDCDYRWIVEPSGWSYDQAKRWCATPNEMDDWSFVYNLVKPSFPKLLRQMDYTYPEYRPSTIGTNTDALETHNAVETVD
jgi:hypothetical protein